jgi:prepilin-type N-terminal cleavage/methylation domain-containing protein
VGVNLMKNKMKKNTRGFTLVELMVSLVLSSFVLLGITSTYSSIHGSIQTSKDLENAQEVIRFSSQVFTRSLKQTQFAPDTTVAQQLTVQQPENVTPCTGVVAPIAAYTEVYTFNAATNVLSCRINAGANANIDVALLTGIANITYQLNAASNLATIIVEPTVLPQNFIGGISIDVALTNLILRAAMP